MVTGLNNLNNQWINPLKYWQKNVHNNVHTKTFALVGGPVHIDFGADNCAKWEEHLGEFMVTKLLGQVVDEEVAALRAFLLGCRHQLGGLSQLLETWVHCWVCCRQVGQ